jgi:hypothetical protein
MFAIKIMACKGIKPGGFAPERLKSTQSIFALQRNRIGKTIKTKKHGVW